MLVDLTKVDSVSASLSCSQLFKFFKFLFRFKPMLNQFVKGLLAEKLLHRFVFFLNFARSLLSLHFLLMLFFKNFSKFVMFNPLFRFLKLLLLLLSLHFKFSQNLVIPLLLFELTHSFLRIQTRNQGFVRVILRV